VFLLNTPTGPYGKTFIVKLDGSTLVNIQEEMAGSVDIKIYPNPLSSDVTLSLSNELKQASVSVTSIYGETVIPKTRLTGNGMTFQMTEIPAGVYIISIEQGGRPIRKAKAIKIY
jgi:hypothetical protein